MAYKSDLRKQALNKRSNLTADELLMFNEKLVAQFKKLDLSEIKSIHTFLPITSKKEPDTFLIIDFLAQHHPEIQIVVPKADFGTSEMSHYCYGGKIELINNHYHIPEPQQATPFIGVPDMVIVPLLAFDKKGHRVGYGKGFYDRFLADSNTLKIGLSFFDAADEIIDVHLNDIRLDKCITPDQIYNFKN